MATHCEVCGRGRPEGECWRCGLEVCPTCIIEGEVETSDGFRLIPTCVRCEAEDETQSKAVRYMHKRDELKKAQGGAHE